MGKTVVLNELEQLARIRGWLVVRLPETTDPVEKLEATRLPTPLAEHDSSRSVRRRLTGAGLTGVESVTTTGEERYPVRQSGETMLVRVLDVLAEHRTGLLVTLDELQAVARGDVRCPRRVSAYLTRRACPHLRG